MCIRDSTHTHTLIHTYTHARTHARAHTHTHTHTHTQTHTHTHTLLRLDVWKCLLKKESFELGFNIREGGEIPKTGRQRILDSWSNDWKDEFSDLNALSGGQSDLMNSQVKRNNIRIIRTVLLQLEVEGKTVVGFF